MKKLLSPVLVLVLCAGSQIACNTVKPVKLEPINCAELVTAEKANDALAKAQIVRIAARDTVATLYPVVLDANQVREYDTRIDTPFTDTYRKARKFIDDGHLNQFSEMCEAFAQLVNQLIPIAQKGGVQ
jgi:hypothetical protein